MPFWGVNRSAWEALCDKDQPAHCTTAATSAQGSIASVGEIGHGDGVIRITGAMLPDPLRQEDNTSDNRFGLASYALTYPAYLVFENLVAYQRPSDGPGDPGPGDPADPLEADISGPSRVRAGDPVTFDGSASTGDIVHWRWDLGDGTVVEGADAAAVTHQYERPGRRTVTLAIEDADGETATAAHTVTVQGPPAQGGQSSGAQLDPTLARSDTPAPGPAVPALMLLLIAAAVSGRASLAARARKARSPVR